MQESIIAVLLFKIGASNAAIEKAAQEIGCPADSLKKRIQNVEYLKHGTGNMSHVATQTENIFRKFDPVLAARISHPCASR